MSVLVLYHHNCADGFTAAWAIRQVIGDGAEYVGATHGNPPPDVTGRDVLLVDFSYKADVLRDIAAAARSVTILDHHKSAMEEVRTLDNVIWLPLDARYDDGWFVAAPSGAIRVLFDMERSGARIAWDVFHPGRAVPWLVRYVEDRDLWRFALPDTRDVQSCVFSFEYDFDIWSRLADACETDAGRGDIIMEGRAITRKHDKDIAELLTVTARSMVIGGATVPVANLPYTMSSDAANILAEKAPFAACYYDKPGGRIFSLRSRPDGDDVSQIAARYGGGGHRNASGFSAPPGWEGDALSVPVSDSSF